MSVDPRSGYARLTATSKAHTFVIIEAIRHKNGRANGTSSNQTQRPFTRSSSRSRRVAATPSEVNHFGLAAISSITNPYASGSV